MSQVIQNINEFTTMVFEGRLEVIMHKHLEQDAKYANKVTETVSLHAIRCIGLDGYAKTTTTSVICEACTDKYLNTKDDTGNTGMECSQSVSFDSNTSRKAKFDNDFDVDKEEERREFGATDWEVEHDVNRWAEAQRLQRNKMGWSNPKPYTGPIIRDVPPLYETDSDGNRTPLRSSSGVSSKTMDSTEQKTPASKEKIVTSVPKFFARSKEGNRVKISPILPMEISPNTTGCCAGMICKCQTKPKEQISFSPELDTVSDMPLKELPEREKETRKGDQAEESLEKGKDKDEEEEILDKTTPEKGDKDSELVLEVVFEIEDEKELRGTKCYLPLDKSDIANLAKGKGKSPFKKPATLENKDDGIVTTNSADMPKASAKDQDAKCKAQSASGTSGLAPTRRWSAMTRISPRKTTSLS